MPRQRIYINVMASVDVDKWISPFQEEHEDILVHAVKTKIMGITGDEFGDIEVELEYDEMV